MTKLTIEVDTAQSEDVMKRAFSKNKDKFNIPDFRKDKAPRTIIEKMYGEGISYRDIADEAVNATCIQAMNGSELGVVSGPEVSVEQIGKGKPFICVAIVTIRSEMTLGEYKGIEAERAEAVVVTEDVDAELKRVQEQSARRITMRDGLVADGDQTVIDLRGFVDGKLFDGGKAEGYALTIGSHSFIDTSEKQLIGKNIGEEYKIDITFPEGYHAAELAGEPATSKVIVRETKVRELSRLDDESAGEVSEFDILDEYKKDIEIKILERRQKETITESENRVIERVVVNAATKIPDKMVEGQIDNMVQGTARRMQSQDPPTEMYIRYTDMTMESMRKQMQPQTLKRIQTKLVLEEVVEAESIQVSDERLDEEIVRMAASYQTEADKLKEYMSDHGKDQMKEGFAVQEAVDFLVAETRLVQFTLESPR